MTNVERVRHPPMSITSSRHLKSPCAADAAWIWPEGRWKAPDNFKVEFFVVRVGDWGGHLLVDCDDPLTVHKFCSMLPAFTMQARPVIAVQDAVRAELEVMAWRDGLTGK